MKAMKKKTGRSEEPNFKLLKNADITPCRMYGKNLTHNTTLVWRILDYGELSRDVMYFQLYKSESIQCIFRLFKYKETLHLSLSSASIFKNMPAEFSILDETNYESITVQAEEIDDGIYVGKFSNEQFLFPGSNFSSNGMLTISFKFVSDYCIAFCPTDLGMDQYLHHWDELCYDLKSMYLDALFPDFFLHVKEYTFKSHKIVLAARSKFFHNLLKSGEDIKNHKFPDDVVPGILHQVLLYIYSGELLEMDEDCMMEVYRLADTLGVTSLCKRSLEWLKKKLCNHNSMKYCEFADKYGLNEMKEMIFLATEEQFPDVKVMDVFKETDGEKQTKGV